ncbi:hypothetical protein GCM10027447_37030 [Glycomyces halotolerans]
MDVAAPAPVALTEHDAYEWRELAEDLTVTDSVKEVLKRYQELPE